MVFSRPRSKELIEKYGSESLIGFTIINSLDELTSEVISTAKIIQGLFGDLEWDGVNQVYLLENGYLGVIGHLSYQNEEQSVYTIMSFVFDYETFKIHDYQIIATRKSFPSGIVMIENTDDCLLYSRIGDTQEGVVKINYPFKGYGGRVV